MTRKDYIAFSKMIKLKLDHGLSSDPVINRIQRKTMLIAARAMAYVMATDNPCFDHQRFFDACGFVQEDYQDE